MELNAFFKITYGVYIITSKCDEKLNGMIATTACQVTSEPVRMTVAINKNNYCHDMISKSGVFGVSVLKQDTDFPFIGRFGFKSGRDTDKMKDINYITGQTGVPLITDNTTAVIENRVIGSLDAGTHTIFLGEAVDAKILNDEPVLTYEYYHKVIKGKSPKNAPTFNIHEK